MPTQISLLIAEPGLSRISTEEGKPLPESVGRSAVHRHDRIISENDHCFTTRILSQMAGKVRRRHRSRDRRDSKVWLGKTENVENVKLRGIFHCDLRRTVSMLQRAYVNLAIFLEVGFDGNIVISSGPRDREIAFIGKTNIRSSGSSAISRNQQRVAGDRQLPITSRRFRYANPAADGDLPIAVHKKLTVTIVFRPNLQVV